MDTQHRLRVGIVGCGNQGTALAEAANRTSTLRVVACADPDKAALNRVTRIVPDASTHASVEALLGESDVDAILIATPHHLLAPIALAALRAGKHVMAEKPIGLSEGEAAEIEAAARAVGVCFMAGYSFRFSMARHVHDLIASGAVGEIQIVTATITCPPMNEDWEWIAFPETGGGPLLFLGSHLVDSILWFVDDDPLDVAADVRWRTDTGADETSAFQIRFVRGAVAQCVVSQATSTVSYTIDIYGRAGRITLRGWSFLQFEIEVVSTTNSAYTHPTVIRPRIGRDNIAMMFVPELEEFVRAVREKREPAITATDGRKVLKVLDAVIKAGRTAQTVKLQ
jgi:phthalate 4,5-cis-dihydrodiol dehydrogenase